MPQPAKGVLAMRRIPVRRVAVKLGCSQEWDGRVLNGLVPAPATFRAGLSQMLDLPEEELFRIPDHAL